MKYSFLELIQHSFSTILLDAIQLFPENKQNSECYGLLSGVEQKDQMECDFAFPIRSVANRSQMTVTPDQKVDAAVQSAKQLFSTSNCIGAYHSHPYEDYHVDMANPSNTDIGRVLHIGLPFQIIIGISRNSEEDKQLSLEMMESSSFEYFYEEKASRHALPDAERLDHKAAYMEGKFQKYRFIIRGYYNTGKSLIDIDLFSSEVDLFIKLKEHEIDFSKLSNDQTHRLREMEYNMRGGGNDISNANTERHLDKLKYKRE